MDPTHFNTEKPRKNNDSNLRGYIILSIGKHITRPEVQTHNVKNYISISTRQQFQFDLSSFGSVVAPFAAVTLAERLAHATEPL